MGACARRLGVLFAAATGLGALGAPGAGASDFDYRSEIGAPREKVFSGGGLTLYASCEPGILSDGVLDVRARSRRDNATIHFDSLSDDGGDEARYGEEDDFDSGQANEVDVDVVYNSVGRIVYTRGQKVVSVDFAGEDDEVPGAADCLFAGTAQAEAVRTRGEAIVFKDNRNDPAETIYKDGHLRLRAECTNFMATPTLILTARALVDDASIAYSSRADQNSDDNAESAYGAIDTMTQPLSFDLTAPPTTPGSEFVARYDSSGQIVFAYQKGSVVIRWLADRDFTDDACLFAGTAKVAANPAQGRVSFKRDDDALEVPFLERGGLQLQGGCVAMTQAVSMFARSTEGSNSTLHAGEQSDKAANGSDELSYFEADDMGGALFDVGLSLSGGDNATGQLVYTRQGHAVSVDYLIDEDGALDHRCAIAGVAAGG